MASAEAIEPAEANSHEIRRRFSVKQVMLQTTIASMLFAALFHENEWIRATLFTLTVAMFFNELLALFFSTGSRRAFAIGHSLALAFFPLFYMGVGISLPYLITKHLLEFLETLQAVNEENFLIVAGIFWAQVGCRFSGYSAVYWYRSWCRDRAKLSNATN